MFGHWDEFLGDRAPLWSDALLHLLRRSNAARLFPGHASAAKTHAVGINIRRAFRLRISVESMGISHEFSFRYGQGTWITDPVPSASFCCPNALYQASSAAEATLNYADYNRESCNISVPLLNQVERYHTEAVRARDNACAGRPLRPYPANIIQR